MAARHAVKLATLPVRIGGAVGAVAVAYYWPWVAGAVGVALLGAGVVAIVGFQVFRRALRSQGRVACGACGYRALPDARICAGCKVQMQTRAAAAPTLDPGAANNS